MTTVRLEGEEAFRAKLRKLLASLDFRKPVGSRPSLWTRIHVAFGTAEREQFDSRGAKGSRGAWAPLSPRYVAWKNLHYPGRPLMVATGAMRASLLGVTGDSIYKTTADTLEMGTTRLAGYHTSDRNKNRWAIDISDAQAQALFGGALKAWGADMAKEWGR